MSFLDKIFRRDTSEQKDVQPPQKRGLIGAIKTRFTEWIHASLTKVNLDLDTGLMMILPKCRYLAKNNPIVRSYLGMLQKNVLGRNGIQFQSQLKNRDDSLDEAFNDKLEWAWYDFRQGFQWIPDD